MADEEVFDINDLADSMGQSPQASQSTQMVDDDLPVIGDINDLADASVQPTAEELGLPEQVYNAIYNFAYSADKSVTEAIDFFGPNMINGLLNEMGIDYQMPTATATFEKYASPPEIQEGLAKEATGTAGEAATLGLGVASLLRRGGMMLPQYLPSEGAFMGTLRQLTAQTPKTMAAETGLGAVSGAGTEVGQEVGGDTGALVGSVAAPLTVAGSTGLAVQGGKAAVKTLDDFLNMTPSTLMRQQVKSEADKIIQNEAMKSGMTYNEIVERYLSLGDKGMLADVDPSFAHAVRVVANENPRFQGHINRELQKRQAGQGVRIDSALSQGLDRKLPEGMTGEIDDDLKRLDEVFSPQITEIYDIARNKPVSLSPKLKNMIENPQGYFKDAAREARIMLDTKRAVGDKISHFDIIDATKKSMDDMISTSIRNGENEKVRALVKAKNQMLDEVDAAIPEYKQARETYAGRASLENAFELGQTFLKPKTLVRDIQEEVSRMTPMEKHYYKLGVKQHIKDIAESENVNRDLVNKYFKKGGTVEKMKILFDDEKAFDNFFSELKNEMDFGVTKNIVTGNSTTSMQMSQRQQMNEGGAASVLTDWKTSAPEKGRQLINIFKGKKPDDEEIFKQAKIEAADFLTNQGVDVKEVQRIMQEGYEQDLLKALEKAQAKANKLSTPLTVGAGSGAAVSESE